MNDSSTLVRSDECARHNSECTSLLLQMREVGEQRLVGLALESLALELK